MKLKFILILILLSCFLLFGCEQVPLQITYFTPHNTKAQVIPSFFSEMDLYKLHEDEDFEIYANICEYNNILTMIMSIKNKTKVDLEPENYSITLTDGRDFKKIKMLTREDILNIRTKYAGNKNAAIQDQVIEATVNNALKVTNVSTKAKMVQLIDLVINNYFSFRPIFANETRRGILCFLNDFKLEYPLGIMLKIKTKILIFYFVPQPKTK